MGPGGKSIGNNITRFWEETDSLGVTVECDYRTEEEKYYLRCYRGDHIEETSWRRLGYEPAFGWDVNDSSHAQRLAEELSASIEPWKEEQQ